MWYKTFEEMPAWQLGDQMNARLVAVIALARGRGDFRFADQLRGAALSVTNNIAEGFERNSKNEFIQFLGIAKGSAGEVRSLLHQAVREQLVTESEHAELTAITRDIGRQLANFIRYLRRKKST